MKKLSLLAYISLSSGLILIGWNRIAHEGVNLSPAPLVKVVESLLATPTPTRQPVKNRETVHVKRAVDGDTIELTDGRRVRYIGVDSPELHHPSKKVQCFAEESATYNSSLVEDSLVQLERDVSETDRFGRLLRYVWKDGVLINDKLVAEGYALASTFPPDVAYAERFTASQQLARQEGKGLWSSCQSR